MTGPVLIAYDGSTSSATAIAVAGRLLSGRRAVVCHAWRGISRALLHGDQLDEAERELAEGLAGEGARLARAAGFDATPLAVREGRKTWRALIDAADSNQASVIVAGAQGLSGIGRALLGSVSTGLVHHSPLPVLVVPATCADETIDGPPLLSYDGSEAAKGAIETAADLLDSRRALLFHSWESWVAEAPALAGASRTVVGMASELDEIADRQSTDTCAQGVAVAERAGLDVEALSERAVGPIWMAVLDAADRHDCAAIVLGSRGLTGISAALGSVSNGVLHHSRRPVLVVPPERGR